MGIEAYIDQILDGLKALGISELIKANPHAMHKLFVSQPVPLTADYMLDLFTTRFSPEGANRRENEEQTVMYWINFIERIEGIQVQKAFNLIGIYHAEVSLLAILSRMLAQ